MLRFFALLLLLVPAQAVFSQKAVIEQSWRDPETMVKLGQFGRILVVAFAKEEGGRKQMEDELVKLLKTKGTASHAYLNEEKSAMTESELSDKMKEDGFDGVLILRMINPEKDLAYTIGTGTYPAYYGNWQSFYQEGLQAFRNEGYLQDATAYVAEINLYQLPKNSLVWNGISNTATVNTFPKIMPSLAKALYEALKKQGFMY